MNRITFRIAIALLTFVIGVGAVSLWILLKQREQKQIVTEQITASGDQREEKTSEIKWLFINEPFEWSDTEIPKRKSGWGFITIFYKNGEWARVHVSVDEVSEDYLDYFDLKERKSNKFIDEDGRVRNKISVGDSDGGYGVEAGNWKEEDGQIKVTINRCICFTCEEFAPVNGYTEEELKNPLPIVENWILKMDLTNKKQSVIQSPIESYRRLSKDEFFDLEDIDSLHQLLPFG